MTIRQFAVYIARRVLAIAALVIIVSSVVFSLLYVAPGSPETILLGTRPSSPATLHALRRKYHLDDPFVVQYARWASHAVRLDFGRSIDTNQPVLDAARQRAAVSLELGGMAFVMTLLLGVPLGILAALRRRGFVDQTAVALSVTGVSAPAYLSGIVLIYFFAVRFTWFPVFGAGSGVVDRAYHLFLPAVALSLTGIGLLLKLTRAAVSRTLETEYVAFARARGIPRSKILMQYVLRNSMVPILTAAGLLLGLMLAGAVLVEVTFSVPGVGSLLVTAVVNKDVPVVQCLALLVAVVIAGASLLADVAIALIDPRIVYTGSPR